MSAPLEIANMLLGFMGSVSDSRFFVSAVTPRFRSDPPNLHPSSFPPIPDSALFNLPSPDSASAHIKTMQIRNFHAPAIWVLFGECLVAIS